MYIHKCICVYIKTKNTYIYIYIYILLIDRERERERSPGGVWPARGDSFARLMPLHRQRGQRTLGAGIRSAECGPPGRAKRGGGTETGHLRAVFYYICLFYLLCLLFVVFYYYRRAAAERSGSWPKSPDTKR